MTGSLWLVAVLVCAQLAHPEESVPDQDVQDARIQDDGESTRRPAASTVVAVTVYRGQALVSRDVKVPEGDGIVELVVTPLPAQAIDNSVFAEGNDGLHVLSTRFRTRAVRNDTRQEVRARQEELKTLQAEMESLRREINVQKSDLQYLHKLEGFTATTLSGLTDKGRLDGHAILDLSRFVMETRGARSKAETDLRRQLQARTEAAEFTARKCAELSAVSSRVERDAVIVVRKSARAEGNVRLGYLVRGVGWSPRYRLRAATDNAPVQLEYLAAVVQQTGEDWSDVRVTLSTATPSLDAAPPELLPLKMAVADPVDAGPLEGKDDRSRAVLAALESPIAMSFAKETPLEDVIKYLRQATANTAFPDGIPIYVDPIGLQEAEKTMTSPVAIDLEQVPLRTSLRLLLEQLGLTFKVKEGLLKITSMNSDEGTASLSEGFTAVDETSGNPEYATNGGDLNQSAASGQAREMHVGNGGGPDAPMVEKDNPGVNFEIAGPLKIPSRQDPQLLEVARVEMPAEYYAKAVPVLTPRFYRLAKLTNASNLVLLPGEATVHVGSNFVGRMRLPLIAPGEPFVAGFGIDPQLQVSRRLMRKSRSLQGGNQVFTYAFRIGLRNYRPGPVKVQVWDRLPKASGETVAVNLTETSAELSTDALYLRTAKMDNLLRWDLEVPAGTIGDKAMYLNYEFRLEYARDLPQPRFLSGGLKEGPIGGGAMGMGGMGGGFMSRGPERN